MPVAKLARRAGLRSQWVNSRGGSNPSPGTIKKEKEMELVQTMLQQESERGIHCKVAWVPANRGVKRGSVITLKDEPESGEWKVAAVYMRQDSENIQRGWGLDLPKTQRTER